MVETIAARATAAGSALRAMVRVSGPSAHASVESLIAAGMEGGAAGCLPSTQPMARRRSCGLRLGAHRLPADLLMFRAPRSYTGEDVVEIYVPGAPPVVAAVLDALADHGVRPAAPGEFTRRACLNGRLDLARAEGIDAMIRATDDAERRGALSLTTGAFSADVARLREALTNLRADLEATIDFPEHEVDPASLPPLAPRVEAVLEIVEGLWRDTVPEDRPPGIADCLLWGRPNAGKSSLFNRLVGRERVRTGGEPGTTRDVIAGRVVTPTGDVRLLDAPGVGLRDERTIGSPSRADRAAERSAFAQRERAALRILVVDLADSTPPPDPGPGDWLLVAQKSDQRAGGDRQRALDRVGPLGSEPLAVIEVSALTGAGIEGLRAQIGRWLEGRAAAADPVIAAGRLHAGLTEGRRELRALLDADGAGLGPECLAVHARDALEAVEGLVGAVPTEALLDAVFSRFCIGK